MFRPGLRSRLTFWTTAVLTSCLIAGFAWARHCLSTILEERNDVFLMSECLELRDFVRENRFGGLDALEAGLRREAKSHRLFGLILIARRPGAVLVAPHAMGARRLADQLSRLDLGPSPRTIHSEGGRAYRVERILLEPDGEAPFPVELCLPLSENQATLSQFDGRVIAGGVAFVIASVLGGLWLSRQALRPVARSIAAARRLDPADLSARLALTGGGDELDQLAATVNDLLDRLAAFHTQLKNFTADASHELRSPLAAMRAAIEVALQQPRDAREYQQILGSLSEQCDRLTELVNGLLFLARADAGQIELKGTRVDVSALVGDMIDLYLPLAEERGISLKWDQPPPALVTGDPSRLGQLVTNLLDNAIKFTEPGGEVRVLVLQVGHEVHFKVADTGSGIPIDHLPHIFDRFHQANAARSSGGSGLGLSICRWIVEAHGGVIQASNNPGLGSTLTVVLPALGTNSGRRKPVRETFDRASATVDV
ncbi:MAG: ATP-binding protein [Isosphaeraceae bacterium]|nr:ATP-binding protein [Isosphaeraceae bacterium]